MFDLRDNARIQGEMMADYWLKLYYEILDDPKMAVMPDRLWRRTIEIFLLAGRLSNKTGILPETRQLAWCLRIETDELELDLRQIESTGIISKTQNGWVVNQFEKRQAPTPENERKRQQRERSRKKQYYQYENVTKRDTSVTQITDTDTDTEEGKTSIPITLNPSIMKIFASVTGMAYIPGSEIDKVIPAIEGLFLQHPDANELIEYLKPFYDNWLTGRTKDNRQYSRSNCAWLYDHAVSGSIPDLNHGEKSNLLHDQGYKPA